jgi:hypothetical protein
MLINKLLTDTISCHTVPRDKLRSWFIDRTHNKIKDWRPGDMHHIRRGSLATSK